MTAHGGNLLLGTLSPERLRALGAEAAHHGIGTVLIDIGETPRFVVFPHEGAVVSIVRSTEAGTMVEAGVIGGEGLFDLQGVLTALQPATAQAVVQIAGNFSRIEASLVNTQFREDETFRDASLRFTSAFLEQVSQNLVCNRLHAIEQRLAKWLLVVRDRAEKDELELTHEFLAHMLGVHRPGVSIAVTALELDGLILHGRNLITIRHPEGLAERSCECYAVMHASLMRYRAGFDA